MKSRSFRATLFFLFFILIIIILYFINHQLVLFPLLFPVVIFVIVLYLFYFIPVFDFIENNSALKYWEIKQDQDTDGKIRIIYNFLYSFSSLFLSNFIIVITSLFFLYKLLNNKDSTLLILVSTTVIILIRIFVYSNRGIAREIGKGFRYAMFPLGFTLFLWDFLYPLRNQYGSEVIFIIVNKYNAILVSLLIAVFVITSLEPIFSLINEIRRDYKTTETTMINWVKTRMINWVVVKLTKK